MPGLEKPIANRLSEQHGELRARVQGGVTAGIFGLGLLCSDLQMAPRTSRWSLGRIC